jgi:hypothetical protein
MKYALAIAALLTGGLLAGPALADRDFDDHPGYRGRPFNEHRHYEHYDHRGRDYAYRGHWRSWHDWDDYYHRHPWLREHGRYYHDDGYLMFRYCDRDGDGCFFFSIGN